MITKEEYQNCLSLQITQEVHALVVVVKDAKDNKRRKGAG